jgi:hypothetical protein
MRLQRLRPVNTRLETNTLATVSRAGGTDIMDQWPKHSLTASSSHPEQSPGLQ